MLFSRKAGGSMANVRYDSDMYIEQLADIRAGDKRAAEQIDMISARIIEHPEVYDSALKGPRAGQFSRRAADQRYRIVFSTCQWCLKVRKVKCAECADRDDNAVTLLDVFLRGKGYD